jgi:hypothetical protein
MMHRGDDVLLLGGPCPSIQLAVEENLSGDISALHRSTESIKNTFQKHLLHPIKFKCLSKQETQSKGTVLVQ